MRRTLRTRLEARRAEIESGLLARVYGISDPTDADPSYVDGLRTSVSVALDYAFAAIEDGSGAPPPPPALLVQARLAARFRVGLDKVLRRYFAGYTLLGNALVEEAEAAAILDADSLKRLSITYSNLLDRLIAAVTEEYEREAGERRASSSRKRVERVQALLNGELPHPSELPYDLDGHHIGIVASGHDTPRTVRDTANALGRPVLLVQPDERTTWAWLGGHRPLDPAEPVAHLTDHLPPGVRISLGESAHRLAGWRFTHRQAAAALSIARRGRDPVVRYADIALLASVSRDDLLATSLRRLYLDPLRHERDGGEGLRDTLRAYFAADHNVTSAAAALGVTRQTVNNRLRAIEGMLGGPLSGFATELELALTLEDLEGPTAQPVKSRKA